MAPTVPMILFLWFQSSDYHNTCVPYAAYTADYHSCVSYTLCSEYLVTTWVQYLFRITLVTCYTRVSYTYGTTIVPNWEDSLQGTSDHTPYLCTEAALAFYARCGGIKGIQEHTEQLLDWAQQAFGLFQKCCIVFISGPYHPKLPLFLTSPLSIHI